MCCARRSVRRHAIERHVVIGAGPAGLTAAWHLALLGKSVVVLEEDPHHVGGLARTMQFEGHRYDVGPHRFYTKSERVQEMWRAMLPEPFQQVLRLTRIFFDRKFFPYPLEVGPTLRGIGALRALRCGASFARARLRPRAPERSFEDWIVNRFGLELYRIFFKTYTEKVWGIPCSEIDKDWAAQRIRGLTLTELALNALFPKRRGQVKSLIERFDYPRLGAGQLWEAVARDVESRGGRVLLGRAAQRLLWSGRTLRAVRTENGEVHEGTHFHVTMTLNDFAHALEPAPPEAIARAGAALRHREFVTVALVVPRKGLFPDQWIYVHDPAVRVARITNFVNWSREMACGDTTVLGMEYFCNAGDALWELSDPDTLALASRELHAIGLAADAAPKRGRVHRWKNAYPVYDDRYRENRAALKQWIAATFDNVYPAGRKGLHNYNSQDHAMMSGTLQVRNAVEGTRFDVWEINTEQEYAEEGDAKREIEERLVPRRRGG